MPRVSANSVAVTGFNTAAVTDPSPTQAFCCCVLDPDAEAPLDMLPAADPAFRCCAIEPAPETTTTPPAFTALGDWAVVADPDTPIDPDEALALRCCVEDEPDVIATAPDAETALRT